MDCSLSLERDILVASITFLFIILLLEFLSLFSICTSNSRYLSNYFNFQVPFNSHLLSDSFRKALTSPSRAFVTLNQSLAFNFTMPFGISYAFLMHYSLVLGLSFSYFCLQTHLGQTLNILAFGILCIEQCIDFGIDSPKI